MHGYTVTCAYYVGTIRATFRNSLHAKLFSDDHLNTKMFRLLPIQRIIDIHIHTVVTPRTSKSNISRYLLAQKKNRNHRSLLTKARKKNYKKQRNKLQTKALTEVIKRVYLLGNNFF